MTKLRANALSLALISTVILSGCGKSEPDIPTFDPMDKVQPQEGWKVERAIAVSPGKDKPVAHHVQSIASGLHDIDFKSPPASMTSVTPSCDFARPDVNSEKYLIVGDGWAQYPLMKNTDVPRLLTITGDAANGVAKKQVQNMIEHGTRKNISRSDVLADGAFILHLASV